MRSSSIPITDTTAQPNVVYYYQIEDVSLDGNRQTLTRGIRLKGHVGVAGKADDAVGRVEAHKLKVCGTKSLLADFDDFGGGFVSGISEFGEVVSSECKFQKEGCVCFFFE